jgi:glycerol-3-phosphate dehydrogenase (NAD(P)+)
VNRLAVIGGGSWGTALSVIMAPRFDEVRLWVYEQDLALRMRDSRVNDVFLPGATLPANVVVTSELADVGSGAGVILGVMPSHHARRVYTELAPHVSKEALVVSATKGLENGSLLRMSEVAAQALAPLAPRVGVLSGPTFAREIARGEPAAVVIASQDARLARHIQHAFSGPAFRLYTNSDPIGVEVGAALKNVIAIAAGVCAGLGLGANSMAALITRGLAEITRLAVAAGGHARTLAGLAGLGDLVLTCHGEQSRNRSVGFELGRGRRLEEILQGMRMVAEGVQTTFAAMDLAVKLRVELPITRQMYAILKEGRDPKDALRELLDRSLKEE